MSQLSKIPSHIERHTGVDAFSDLSDQDLIQLANASNGDQNIYSCMIKRRIAGEPLPYIVGFIELDGIKIKIDKRAYITDPEAIHLINHMKSVLHDLPSSKVLEVGTGCGSLSFCIQKSVPHHTIVAVDIDSNAIDLAKENASELKLDIQFLVSDYFMGLSDDYEPNIVFADPPWGSEESIYEDDRPVDHYHAMPGISVWPFKSITGIHEQIIDEILLKKWSCDLYMNFGMLDDESIQKALNHAPNHTIYRPAKNVTIVKIQFLNKN